VRIPKTSETGRKDCMESGCVDPHRGNDGAVFMPFVEASPGCSKPRVREEAWASKVLPTRTPVFDGPGMVFVRANDESRGSEPHLVLGLVFVLNLEPMLKEEVLEKEEVVVHG